MRYAAAHAEMALCPCRTEGEWLSVCSVPLCGVWCCVVCPMVSDVWYLCLWACAWLCGWLWMAVWMGGVWVWVPRPRCVTVHLVTGRGPEIEPQIG